MSSRTVVLLIAAISTVLVAWLGRYEVVAVPAGGQGSASAAYRLDRWTGNVIWLLREESYAVKPGQQ